MLVQFELSVARVASGAVNLFQLKEACTVQSHIQTIASNIDAALGELLGYRGNGNTDAVGAAAAGTHC